MSQPHLVTIKPVQPEDRKGVLGLLARTIPEMSRGLGGFELNGWNLAVSSWNEFLGYQDDYSGQFDELKKDEDGIVRVPDEAAALAASPVKCQVAHLNDRIIGLIEYDTKGHVRTICVDSHHRQQGLAKSLLSAAAHDIKQHGNKWLSMRVSETNYASNQFFDSLVKRNLMEYGESVSFMGNYTGFRGRAARLDIWPTENFALPLPDYRNKPPVTPSQSP